MDYQKVYNALISKRKEFPLKKSKDLYVEIHHIVPKCLGGTNDENNLISLTGREHFIAHRLLSKIYPSNESLQISVWCMCSTRKLSMGSSRVFEKLKKEYFDSETVRARLSEAGKKKWSDPEYRLMRSKSAGDKWKDEEYRRMMEENNKQVALARWKDQNYRKRTLKTLREGHKGWCERYLLENPWPWQRCRGQSKIIWGLAATAWELSAFNPECSDPMGYTKFCTYFLNGKYVSVVSKMFALFKTGWAPHECESFIKEYGHKM